MTEFKVGDKVEIVKDPPCLRDEGYVGKVGEITEVNSPTNPDSWGSYMVEWEGDGCWCRHSDIRKVTTFSDELDAEQKKSAFKVGQWVETLAGSSHQYGAKAPTREVNDNGRIWVEGVDDGLFVAEELRLLGSDEIPETETPSGSNLWGAKPGAMKVNDQDSIYLNPSDPFEAALIDIVQINRKKRADYATDDDIFSNFRGAGRRTGLEASKIVDVMIAIKEERMAALEANGREPENEAVIDTLLDRACYSVIGYALGKEEANG